MRASHPHASRHDDANETKNCNVALSGFVRLTFARCLDLIDARKVWIMKIAIDPIQNRMTKKRVLPIQTFRLSELFVVQMMTTTTMTKKKKRW